MPRARLPPCGPRATWPPPDLPPGPSPRRASPPTASAYARRPRRPAAERDPGGTLSLLTPLGRPQLHHHVAEMALAVEVPRILLDEDTPPLDVPDSAAVRADRSADAYDVSEAL